MRSANFTSHPKTYIVFTYLSLFIFGLIDNSRGPIYPKVIEVFSLSNSESSWIFTLASLLSFIVTMCIPLWLSRFGAVKASKAAMLFHVAALLCMGLSSFNPGLYWVFLGGSVFLGLAMGVQSVTVNLVISKVSTPHNSSKLFSGLHSMYGAASLAGPLFLGAVFRYGASWQWTVALLALAPLAHFLYFYKLPPLDLDQAATDREPIELSRVLRLGIIFSFYVSTEILISSRMVNFLYKSGEVPLDVASYCLSAFFIFLLGGRLLFSFYTPSLKSSLMLKLSAFLTLSFFILSLLASPYFIVFTGASISYFFPFGMNYIKSSKRTRNNAEAVIAKVMMFVGAMIAGMHFVFGIFSESFGVEAAMWIGPALCGVVLLLLFFESGD